MNKICIIMVFIKLFWGRVW